MNGLDISENADIRPFVEAIVELLVEISGRVEEDMGMLLCNELSKLEVIVTGCARDGAVLLGCCKKKGNTKL